MIDSITIVVANEEEILQMTTGLKQEKIVSILRKAADAIESSSVQPEELETEE